MSKILKTAEMEFVDETEIFKGAENTLAMQQVYTWQFQCKYNLKDYPFPAQVILIICNKECTLFFRFAR